MDWDSTLRGDAYGQMTPEGTQLWNENNNILNSQRNAPMRNVTLRSGAQIQIPDIGPALKNRMLSNTLSRMSGTGLGTRAKPQPGYLSQLAPFFIAMGMNSGKNGKEGGGSSSIIDLISKWFGNSGDDYSFSDAAGEDWWSGLYEPSDAVGEDWWSGLID